MKIRGLIFDFDGLILDTEQAEFQSWQEFFSIYQLDLPFSEWSLCIGTSNKAFDVYEYFKKKVGKPIPREEIDRVRVARLYELVNQLSPLPGVVNLIEDAKANGLKIGLASSSPYQWVSSHLKRLGLFPFFDSIRTKEDVVEVKPNPDLYLKSIEALGLSSSNAVVFEDSPNGIKAAKAAGLFCIAVPNQLTRMMDTSEADINLVSLDGVHLDFIEKQFNRKNR